MKALALGIIAVAAVLVVVGRFRRNTPVAIVGYAMLAVGLILGVLSRWLAEGVLGESCGALACSRTLSPATCNIDSAASAVCVRASLTGTVPAPELPYCTRRSKLWPTRRS